MCIAAFVGRKKIHVCTERKTKKEVHVVTYPWSEGKDVYICAIRQKKMTMTLLNKLQGSKSVLRLTIMDIGQPRYMLSVVEVDIEVN